ncbi:MAG: transglycosylase SLT domain-containing protein [Nitrospinota bacterium]|nr:transglycosylase SLT domain-containing protein [Nitrospinota bacterium]
MDKDVRGNALLIIAIIVPFLFTSKPAYATTPNPFGNVIKYFDIEDYPSALAELDNIHTFIRSQDAANVAYLRGHAYSKLNNNIEAERHFRKAGKNDLVGDYALFNIAQMLLDREDYEELVNIADRFLAEFPFSPLYSRMVIYKAKGLVKRGNVKDAMVLIKNHLSQGPDQTEDALWEYAQYLEITGDSEDAYRTYQKIYYMFPHSPISQTAFKQTARMQKEYPGGFPTASYRLKYRRVQVLMRNGMFKDAEDYLLRLIRDRGTTYEERSELMLKLAICLKRLGKIDRSITQYNKIINLRPVTKESPQAMYHLSRLLWNQGKDMQAHHILSEMIREYPNHPHTALAYYISARIEEKEKKYDSAIKNFNLAVKNFPRTEIAEDCLWHLGWLYYKLGQHEDADKTFLRYVYSYPYSDELSKVYYWLGRNQEKMGKSGENYYATLKKKFPFSYYTHSASSGYAKPVYAQASLAHPDGFKLRELVQKELDDSFSKMKYKPKLDARQKWYLNAAQNWGKLGFPKHGQKLVNRIAVNLEETTENNIWLSYVYFSIDDYPSVLRQFWKLWGDNEKAAKARGLVTMLMFPLSHWETILNEADRNGIDPFLILSIIRQESSFNTRSISPANARGLMQIIPATGKRISRALSIENFKAETLHDPDTNIKMGAFYLAFLLKDSDGDIIPAIASYNAGKSKVTEWFKRYSYDDIEEFIEQIPYPETRGYVKQVLRNYGIYRSIYEQHFGADRLSAR